jgi:phosphoglycolate phosphatase
MKELSGAGKTILFDFDGTIAETVTAGVAIFNNLARQYGFGQITPKNATTLRDQGARAAMKALDIPLLRVPLIIQSLRRGIQSALPTLAVVDGMANVIRTAEKRGYRIGIVSTNSEENIRAFLKHNAIEGISYFQTGVGLFGKARAIKNVMEREKLSRENVTYIGDEIRDVEAGQKNNIRSIAVTWGVNSKEGLLQAKPDAVVDTAKALLGLF